MTDRTNPETRTGIESSPQRSSGEPEREQRIDGGGRRDPLPSSEAARGDDAPERVDAPEAATEVWTPEEGTRKTDPVHDRASSSVRPSVRARPFPARSAASRPA